MRPDVRTSIRLSQEIVDKIKESAVEDRRSWTHQLVALAIEALNKREDK